MFVEKTITKYNGWGAFTLILLAELLLVAITIYLMGLAKTGVEHLSPIIAFLIFMVVFVSIAFAGLFTIEPNEAIVFLFVGKYVGTIREPGLGFVNPFYTKKKISLRVRNFDTSILKVNDQKGNPIEISTVVVWHVGDTAQALFIVENYIDYIKVQCESAIRHIATSYPYDSHEGEPISLRSSIDEVSEGLTKEIQERVITAGIVINETRINHLAYAPEIAHAMLQRQQAEAIISARQKIVDGAVGMVEMALHRLKVDNIVELDEERKAAMVCNLLVVLCSDRGAQPIVNSGSLY